MVVVAGFELDVLRTVLKQRKAGLESDKILVVCIY
jgi:hypothetical protein